MLNPFRGWRQAVYFVEKGLTAIPAWRSIHASPHAGATEETMAATSLREAPEAAILAEIKKFQRKQAQANGRGERDHADDIGRVLLAPLFAEMSRRQRERVIA